MTSTRIIVHVLFVCIAPKYDLVAGEPWVMQQRRLYQSRTRKLANQNLAYVASVSSLLSTNLTNAPCRTPCRATTLL